MEQLASEGSKRASLVLVQLDRIDEYLSACQLGITMASIGIGFPGEPALASLIEPLFGGCLSHGVGAGVCNRIHDRHLAPHHGREQVPNWWRSMPPRHGAPPRPAARSVPHGTALLTWALNKASNAILRLFGIRPADIERSHLR